ncbi:MAG TPA: HEAT repeat domain-containing protein, partial [Armatimonadetes bacterium]|nr:HEAT repeat domain-containing protein [Armatimonadota bacterium]
MRYSLCTSLFVQRGRESMEYNDTIRMSEGVPQDAEQLKRLLHSPDESVRAGAVQHLSNFKPSQALPLLIHALTDESLLVRQRAIDVLVMHGESDRAVIVELVNQLASSDANIRSGALDALMRLGKVAVGELCNALDDESVDRRILAATALGSIAEPSATDALLAHLTDPAENVRHTVIEALGNIGDERATEPLIAVAQHADWQLRIAAINSLGQLRDERAVDTLLSILNDKLLRYAVIDALGAIADSRPAEALVPFIGSRDSELHARARHALVQIGQFVEWWGRLIDADSMKRFQQALSKVTMEGIDALYEDALSEDDEVRAEACYLLGLIPSEVSAEALVRLLDVPSASHRALQALSNNAYSWYALRKLWWNSPQQFKADWLNTLQEARTELPAEGIEWLLELIHAGGPDIQSSALRILAMQPAHLDIPVEPILDASHHESSSVRASAVLVLSRWHDARVCERLVE